MYYRRFNGSMPSQRIGYKLLFQRNGPCNRIKHGHGALHPLRSAAAYRQRGRYYPAAQKLQNTRQKII
jgi:hypothetical protein